MQKYQYKYVKIKRKIFSGWEKNYQEVIDQHAKDGWRLVEMFAPAIHGYGSATHVDLVFEKKKSSDF